MNDRKENLKLESIVVHGANGTDPYTGSLSYPIYQTATFKHPSIEDRANYNYARCINPILNFLNQYDYSQFQ